MAYNKEELFITDDSKKRRIYTVIVIIVLLVLIGLISLRLHVVNNKETVITYDEESNLDYKVYLKDNDYFGDKYLEKDKQYIASLIDYIDTSFDYDLTITNRKEEYNYSYRIDAEVNVVNSTNDNVIYNNTETLVKTKKGIGVGDEATHIKEKLKIDYNKYNELISEFVDTYDLSNVNSTLSVSLYVDFDGECDANSKHSKKSVIKLVIPLTTKTVAIDMSTDVTNNTGKFIKCDEKHTVIFLILGIVAIVIAICVYVQLMKYIEENKSPLEMYNSKLKKIMNNYGSFIQKINNDYDMSKSQILKVDSFDDMLEIRDTLQAPILMLENQEKNGVFFIIPTAYNVLYTYALRVEDIKTDAFMEEKEGDSKAKTPKKEKEYTDEYITKQLTMISSQPTNKENVIEGKDSNDDLYSQIEKTQEFRMILEDEEIKELFDKIDNTDVVDTKKRRKKARTKSKAKTSKPAKTTKARTTKARTTKSRTTKKTTSGRKKTKKS